MADYQEWGESGDPTQRNTSGGHLILTEKTYYSPSTGAGKGAADGRQKRLIIDFSTSDVTQSTTNPPHFSIDVQPDGYARQHIRKGFISGRLPQYARVPSWPSVQERNMNRLAIVLQVKVPSIPTKNGGQLSNQNLDKLAWWLWKITVFYGIPLNAPVEWRTNYGYDPNEFLKLNGVLGMGHVPGVPDSMVPFFGYLDHQDLNRRMAEQRNAANLNAPGDATTPYERVEEEYDQDEDSSGGDSAEEVYEDYSMEHLPFRFNPPLHASMTPQRVEFSSNNWQSDLTDDYLIERGLDPSILDATEFNKYRLGRFVQHHLAGARAALNPARMGMRFLYNPTKVAVQATRNTSLIINPQSTISAVVSGVNQNFQVINLDLLLVRGPDVMLPSAADQYSPGILDEDLEGLHKYGTHWDLEYLYRATNGIYQLSDRGLTGNIGVITPSNMRLVLGKENFFGFIEKISWEDTHFAPNMVPIITRVNVQFRRHVDMSPTDLALLVGHFSALDDDGSSSGDSGDSSGSSGGDSKWSSGSAKTPLGWRNAGKPLNAGWTYSSGAAHRSWDIGMSIGTPLASPVNGTIGAMRTNVPENTGHYRNGPQNYMVIHFQHPQHGQSSALFGHLSPTSSGLGLKVGDKVSAGQHIAYSGNTGNSSGPHLHYNMQKTWVGTNRYRYLNANPSETIWEPNFEHSASTKPPSTGSTNPNPGRPTPNPHEWTAQ